MPCVVCADKVWSPEGVETESYRGAETICCSRHLSSFAVSQVRISIFHKLCASQRQQPQLACSASHQSSEQAILKAKVSTTLIIYKTAISEQIFCFFFTRTTYVFTFFSAIQSQDFCNTAISTETYQSRVTLLASLRCSAITQ